jgi:hypothetical protein
MTRLWVILCNRLLENGQFPGYSCPSNGQFRGICLKESQPLKRTFAGQTTPFKRTFEGVNAPLKPTFAVIPWDLQGHVPLKTKNQILRVGRRVATVT